MCEQLFTLPWQSWGIWGLRESWRVVMSPHTIPFSCLQKETAGNSLIRKGFVLLHHGRGQCLPQKCLAYNQFVEKTKNVNNLLMANRIKFQLFFNCVLIRYLIHVSISKWKLRSSLAVAGAAITIPVFWIGILPGRIANNWLQATWGERAKCTLFIQVLRAFWADLWCSKLVLPHSIYLEMFQAIICL